MQHVEIVALDYGGVIARDYCEPFASDLARLLRVSVSEVEALVSESSEHGARLRLAQMTVSEFWSVIAGLVGLSQIDADHAQDLWARSFEVRPDMLTLMSELRKHYRKRVMILANTDVYRAKY